MPTPERTSLDEIVSAAARLLETGGVAAVTMQAVAQDVGVGTVGSRAQRLQLSGGIVVHRFMLA